MHKILWLLAAVTLSGLGHRQMKNKIIFFGDSITEQGARPGGYIRVLDSMLQQKDAGKNYSLVGAGIGGNKIYDLYLRLEDDVLAKDPDIVVIWIGVNDVWHKRSLGTGTDADKFEKFYTAIITKLQARRIRIFLCTPAVVGEKNDSTNELDGDLNKYAGIIRALALRNDCTLIDLRQSFARYLQANNPDNKDRGVLTTDGVHLNAAGNRFVAEQMFERLAPKP